jgi:GNAT superfamily N-acetyltransferase
MRSAMERNAGDSSGPPAYTLRAATADDVAFIHALRVSGLRVHVERIWGWDDGDQRARFARRYVAEAYQVIEVDARDVGAVSVEWGSDGVFLDDVEIAAEWRGLGNAVLGGILTEAQRRGLPVRLQVLRGNPARRWYERLGRSTWSRSP